jgi:hypothetical protein
MPAGFLPDDLTSTIGDLINRVRKLESFKPSPPQLAPPVPPAFTLLTSNTGAGPVALPGVLGGLATTNLGFTTTYVNTQVMVIGTGSMGALVDNAEAATASVGVSGVGFAPLSNMTATDVNGAGTTIVPITSLYIVTLGSVTSYTAQWQGHTTGGLGSSLWNWSVFVFQLSPGAPGTVAIP